MGRNHKNNMQVMWILKALLACYTVTGGLLLLVSFLLYKFDLNEQIVMAGIVSIYVVSTIVGGYIAGKIKRQKKGLWGGIIGVLYFTLLVIISYGVHRQIGQQGVGIITTALLSVGGGMLGGMVA